MDTSKVGLMGVGTLVDTSKVGLMGVRTLVDTSKVGLVGGTYSRGHKQGRPNGGYVLSWTQAR